MSPSWTLRSDRHTGDLAWLLAAHAGLADELGWDASFEAYVAQPMSTCMLAAAPYERIWIAEQDGEPRGSIAIVQADSVHSDAQWARKTSHGRAHLAAVPKLQTAQLRWFLVRPEARGQGLGKALLEQAIAFSREIGYDLIILWTVGQLEAAAHLYREAGFERLQQVPGKRWGSDVIEEQYRLVLRR
jgi:GNAT superfamily N-acetyltransferase